MMKSKKRLWISLSSALTTLILGASIGIGVGLSSNEQNKKGYDTTKIEQNASKGQWDQATSTQNAGQTLTSGFNTDSIVQLIDTPTGPIVANGNTISALSWFGTIIWQFNASYILPYNWVNWAYDSASNSIWILFSAPWGVNQSLIQISSQTGIAQSVVQIPGTADHTYNGMYFLLTVLENGNIVMYSYIAGITNGGNIYVTYNPYTQKFSSGSFNPYNYGVVDATGSGYTLRLINVIPVALNVNILVFVQWTNLTVSFAVADDNLNSLGHYGNLNNTASFNTPRPSGVSQRTPIRNYFGLLDGRKIFFAWNKVWTFKYNPLSPNYIQIETQSLQAPLQSVSIDAQQNFYFKYLNSPQIMQMITPQNINQQYVINNYADLSTTSNPQISSVANNYWIFPLSAQVGKVMLVNSSNGIAVAVVPNKGSSDTGDILGALNGDDPFLQKPTFELSQSAYFQTPSEITSSDIVVKNGTFISMTKNNINDATGQLSLTVQMGYVPWFETASSANMLFLNEQQSFNLVKVNSFAHFSSILPPQYQNMLPSSFTPEILAKINPFTLDLKLDVTNKSYRIVNANNDTGTLTIQAVVTYKPVDYSGTLTYNSNEYTYTWGVSSSTWKPNPDLDPSTNPQGKFTLYGETNLKSTVNINTIPNLKYMTASNILPSSFTAADLYKFIDFSKTYYYNVDTLNYQIIEANDATGTLVIQVTGNQQTVAGIDLPAVNVQVTYTGFNKISDYSFAWNASEGNNVGAIQSALGINYSEILPSNVTNYNVLTNFLNLNGFNSSDFSVTNLTPNDTEGTLTVSLKLNTNFPAQLQNISPLADGTITTILTGFLSTEKLGKKYSVNFVTNDNPNIAKLKEFAPSQITQAQASTFYTIPTSSYYFGQTPTITLYPNNINGSLSVVLSFTPPTGLDVQSVFVQTYTGFQFVDSTDAYTVIFAQNAPSALAQKMPSQISLDDVLSNDLLTIKGFNKSDLVKNIKLVPNDYLGTLTILVSFSSVKYPLASITSFASIIPGFLKLA